MKSCSRISDIRNLKPEARILTPDSCILLPGSWKMSYSVCHFLWMYYNIALWQGKSGSRTLTIIKIHKTLDKKSGPVIIMCANGVIHCADIAQLAERPPCKRQVIGSSPIVGSVAGLLAPLKKFKDANELTTVQKNGELPKWPTGSDCKSDSRSFRRFESFTHHWFHVRSWWKPALILKISVRHKVIQALIAQLVERTLGKGEVIGSNPI